MDGPSSSRPKKESKSSSIEKAFEAWTEFSIARTKKLEGEGRLDTSSKTSDPYSIEACIEVLSSLDGVDDAHYMKACRKFTDATWRTMFIRVPLEKEVGLGDEFLKTLVLASIWLTVLFGNSHGHEHFD
ncbi:hypothetical protein F0562_000260 [Nyssa sinensis]|uniref:Uncharacterized protein n=1 Tax=Nyssa sinensis TaxID=561372 RepID=A0A5J5BZ36_9ASTE|nr:hypothetical protein F0562_000260 [Nyssa sinensis]